MRDIIRIVEGGFPTEPTRYTRQELERWDIDELDRMAWGHAQGDVITLKPSEINIKYKGDLENPEHKFTTGGVSWVRSVNFAEPVQVSIGRDGKFYLEDGHHRWFAASKLQKSLTAEVTKIDGNPITEILRKQGD